GVGLVEVVALDLVEPLGSATPFAGLLLCGARPPLVDGDGAAPDRGLRLGAGSAMLSGCEEVEEVEHGLRLDAHGVETSILGLLGFSAQRLGVDGVSGHRFSMFSRWLRTAVAPITYPRLSGRQISRVMTVAIVWSPHDGSASHSRMVSASSARCPPALSRWSRRWRTLSVRGAALWGARRFIKVQSFPASSPCFSARVARTHSAAPLRVANVLS